VINLRYHIVSITAVFLALGIGLTLGSSFLDRVTVDNLKNQLESVQARVDDTEREIGSLRDQVDALTTRDEALAEAIPERLVAGHLTDVPVLVVATEGTDDALVDRVIRTIEGAGGEAVGTWWLTSRWTLDDEEEVTDLRDLLDVDTDDVDRLLRNGAIRLADVLLPAMGPADPSTEGDDAASGDGATDPEGEGAADPEGEGAAPTTDGGSAEGGSADEPTQDDPALPSTTGPSEPADAAALEAGGFLDYTLPAGRDGDRVELPATGLRVVVVSGADPGTGPHRLALSLLDEVSAEGAVPVVAAQAEVDVVDEEGAPLPESERRTAFVGTVRQGELTGDRISTIDDLDTAAGVVALVLALEDAGELRIGHYGVGPGAAGLLPGTDPGS